MLWPRLLVRMLPVYSNGWPFLGSLKQTKLRRAVKQDPVSQSSVYVDRIAESLHFVRRGRYRSKSAGEAHSSSVPESRSTEVQYSRKVTPTKRQVRELMIVRRCRHTVSSLDSLGTVCINSGDIDATVAYSFKSNGMSKQNEKHQVRNRNRIRN